MRRDGFYIIRCPRCGRYTFAPIRQKTRFCVYCQRIFKVNPLNAQYVEDAKTATTLVKFYNTGKHHEEFMEAVERSRAQVTALIPSRDVKLESLSDEEGEHRAASSSRRRLLEEILYRCAKSSPIELHVLEEECRKAGLPWSWVSRQLEALTRSGRIVCPRPWLVRLVTSDVLQDEKPTRHYTPTALARRIGEVIREAGGTIHSTDLMNMFQRQGVTATQVEEALELLKVQGYILKTRDGNYRWTGS